VWFHLCVVIAVLLSYVLSGIWVLIVLVTLHSDVTELLSSGLI